MLDRVPEEKKSSGVSKAALATAIGAGVVALGRGNGGGGLLNGLLGYGAAPAAATTAATTAALETTVMLPLLMGAYSGGHHGRHHNDDDFVTKEVLNLVRENAGKDAEIARLKSENFTRDYTDGKIEASNNRICELEKLAAVNAARDHDFRHYVDREFVHQPRAYMNESIVTHQPSCCCCGGGRCDGHHGHGDRDSN